MNKNAKAEHIDKALDDPNYEVGAAATKHPNLNSNHIEKLLNSTHNDHIRLLHTAMLHKKVTSEQLHRGIEHSDLGVNASTLENDKIKPEHIDKALDMKGFQYENVRENAIEHPNASSENIHKALNDSYSLIRRLAIQHPNATPEHIDKALDDPSDIVRENAIQHPNVSPENITKSLDDPSDSVRGIAVSHPNATPEHIDKALDDPNEIVRRLAIEHPNATSENIHKALDLKGEDNDVVRENAIQHPNATPENIHKALDDPNEYVRREAIKRPNATPENIDKALKLKGDANRRVRISAIEHPNATHEVLANYGKNFSEESNNKKQVTEQYKPVYKKERFMSFKSFINRN
jgi:HEAT repeat protein